MQERSIFDIEALPGSIFVDNLMVSSADRLLSRQYYDLPREPDLQDPIVASALFSYDLLNSAILVESIVCHDSLYVNAESIDIWNKNIWQDTLQPLQKIISPVAWPSEQRLEVERQLSPILRSILADASIHAQHKDSSFLKFFADVVLRATHERYDSYRYVLIEDKFFSQPLSHPWSSVHAVLLGAAFYLMCSQVIGVPYKPSILRASILSNTLQHEFHRREFDAAGIAMDLLEKSREEVAKQYFEKLLELNLVETRMPCVLAAILKEARSPSDVLPIALQIRESKEAKAFRTWSADFSGAIQKGDLVQIGVFHKEVEEVVKDVNKMLGITNEDSLKVTLGWGPVSLGRAFSLPKVIQRPIRLKRHLWFLHNMYTELATMARFSTRVEQVLMPGLPDWFHPQVPSEANWGYLRH